MWFALVAVVLVSSAGAARAGNTPFEKGTKSFVLDAEYVQPIRFSDDRLYGVDAELGYYFWKNTSFSLEAQGAWVEQPGGGNNDAILGGLGILGRTHLIVHDHFSFFIDGGIDFTYSDQNVPQYGTHFNFNPKVGVGATYQLEDRTFLIGGARYYHISNGKIHGSEDNPSYDGVQFWGGVMWTW
jgi:hypothetical protein